MTTTILALIILIQSISIIRLSKYAPRGGVPGKIKSKVDEVLSPKAHIINPTNILDEIDI